MSICDKLDFNYTRSNFRPKPTPLCRFSAQLMSQIWSINIPESGYSLQRPCGDVPHTWVAKSAPGALMTTYIMLKSGI